MLGDLFHSIEAGRMQGVAARFVVTGAGQFGVSSQQLQGSCGAALAQQLAQPAGGRPAVGSRGPRLVSGKQAAPICLPAQLGGAPRVFTAAAGPRAKGRGLPGTG